MEIREVSVTYGRKLNLGDFNSAHVEITISAALTADEDAHAAMTALWAMATANVKAKAAEFIPKLRLQEYFLGVPIENEEEANGN